MEVGEGLSTSRPSEWTSGAVMQSRSQYELRTVAAWYCWMGLWGSVFGVRLVRGASSWLTSAAALLTGAGLKTDKDEHA